MSERRNLELEQDGFGHNLIGNEPVLFHCHFFNMYLQQTILDAQPFGNTREILVEGATSVVSNSLNNILSGVHSAEERKQISQEVFRKLGFGLLDISDVDENGGVARVKSSHWASGHLAIKGKNSSEPVCYFPAGFISASVSAVYDMPPGSFSTTETKCLAKGDDVCEFQVEKNEYDIFVPRSFGNSCYPQKKVNISEEGKWGNINISRVLEGLSELKLEGNDQGLIPAFGVFLTNMFGNYYNYIVYKTTELILKSGEGPLAYELFVESGHVCAFNTLGGIMKSAEWEALIKPMIKNTEDWIYGIVAVMNGLGWGQYTVEELIPSEYIRIRAYNHYETIGFSQMYHRTSNETCYLGIGATAGIMNLVYKGKIMEKPELTPEFYVYLFRKGEMFVGREMKCVNRGDEFCVFEAGKKVRE